jgi:hypothetical protein
MLGRGPISSYPISGASSTLSTAFAWRGQLVDLDLVTRIEREDGTFVEFVNERRGLVKSSRRRKGVLELTIVDVDRSALEALVPSKRYTIADFPKIFVDHTARAVPQVVGDALKVPLTYIDNTVGAYRYSAGEVLATGAPTVRTLYRNGRIVSAVEYVVDTVAVGATTHLRVTFVKEQKDEKGSLYELTADLLGPGSRAASDEIRRLILQAGGTIDASSFDRASLYCNLNRMLVDCGYVSPRQTIGAVQDLLQVARGQLYKTPAGAWGIFIDRPRDVHLALNDTTDELAIDEYLGEPEITKTLTLEYRPASSSEEKFTGSLSRTTRGVTGETPMKNPYIRDHEVADRLLSYLQKRENAFTEARGSIHAVQLSPGELVAIAAPNHYDGWKVFAAPQVSRPADRNQVVMREYDESIHTYTAAPGGLPADATSGYQPDYSQTPPVAPTGLVVVSQGTSADTDGKVTAFALVRAVPPAVNWAELWVQLVDTTTGEQYNAQLFLNAGNYEATVSGMRPNRLHSIVVYAKNGFNIAGATATIANFTSANYTTAPNAPASCSSQQQSPRQNYVGWATVADVAGQPKIRRYILFKKIGAGAFVEISRPEGAPYIDDNIGLGNTYQYKVRAEDINGNESADSPTTTITPGKLIDDSYILGSGVSGASIANASINQGRGYTGTGSGSIVLGTGPNEGQISLDVYTFYPGIDCGSAVANTVFLIACRNKPGAGDAGEVRLRNTDTTTGITVNFGWRKFNA